MISQLLAAALFMAPIPPAPGAAATAEAAGLISAEQVVLLRDAIEEAPLHGLDARRFATPALDVMLGASDPVKRRQGEILLIQAAARYGAAVRSGALPAAAFPSNWAQRPPAYDAAGELAEALAAQRLTPWLARLAPPGVAYAQLQTVLMRYRVIETAGGWPAVPSGKPLQLRAVDDRVPVLRDRLALEAPQIDPGQGDVFDEALAHAVADYQSRHGLSPTGKVDPRTLAELNVPVGVRIDQIRANLERRRWAPRTPAPTRIEVNVASQMLDYYRENELALTMRIIVGRPADPTPLFSDQIESIVFNPPWNVPAAIAAKEIWPKARRDPAYLGRNDFVIVPGTSGLGLQQRPGPKSALGRVKFDLPNHFDVYLHDTPNHRPFAADVRALSHGCVRLDRPIDLANRLLADDPKWTGGEIAAAVDRAATLRVALARPVPVTIAYWTVFVDPDGHTQFRPDLYGWDARLIALMGG